MSNGQSFPYKDLVSEVARRRFTMTSRYSELGGRGVPESAGDTGECLCIQMCSSMAGRRQIL